MRNFIALTTALLLLPLCSFSSTPADSDIEALLESFFEEQVSLSPQYQTYLGRKTHYDEWNDNSPRQSALYQSLYRDQLQRLEAINKQQLNAANQLNYDLMQLELEQSIENYRWRDHNYPVNQMFGAHAGIPAFLINAHRIDDVSDAEAYIARLNGIGPVIDQLIENLQRRAEKNILAPAFVYPYVLNDCLNIISGAPFDDAGKQSPLLEDFSKKVTALNETDNVKKTLTDAAKKALIDTVEPAYQRLITSVGQLESRADDRAGAWKLPEGDAFYRNALQRTTTTDMSPDEIYTLGLDEVARIHDEIREIMRSVKFVGSLADFFNFTRSDARFYYPDSEQGRADYLADTRQLIDTMKQQLPHLFGHLPNADISVKAVEPFREKSAGKAFYQSPADDGSRPGVYYVNLHDLSAMPRYQMEALAYHEALPGHHMQISVAQEMSDLPAFRRHGHYTAYIEGWGLYAERIPKEIGFYADPYSDFGRLSMELWRAIRLVVDTGIHSKKWSREKAIDYFVDNSPMTRADATREVERYIVMPAQATAYKVSMNHILALREHARTELKTDFSLPEFHDQILGGGALPLSILSQRIDDWITRRKSQPATETGIIQP